MRHQKNTVKLGRTTAQREALFASQLSHLILKKRIRTTLPKAKAAKRLADRLVTIARGGTLARPRRDRSERPRAERGICFRFWPRRNDDPGQ